MDVLVDSVSVDDMEGKRSVGKKDFTPRYIRDHLTTGACQFPRSRDLDCLGNRKVVKYLPSSIRYLGTSLLALRSF